MIPMSHHSLTRAVSRALRRWVLKRQVMGEEALARAGWRRPRRLRHLFGAVIDRAALRSMPVSLDHHVKVTNQKALVPYGVAGQDRGADPSS